MKRLLFIAVIALTVLAVLLASFWFWLTGTAGGASFALARAQGALPGLEYRHVEGGLDDGVVLEEVRFAQDGLELRAARIELAARIRPLRGTVEVNRVRLNDIEVQLPPPVPEDPAAEPFAPGDYRLPLTVHVEDLRLDGFVLRDDQGETLLALTSVALSASADNALEIRTLALHTDTISADASGRLGLDAPWQMDLALGAEVAIDGETNQRVSARLEGPLDALVLNLEARGPAALDGSARVAGLPDPGALDLSATVTGAVGDWPGLAGRISDIEVELGGPPDDWQLTAGSTLDWPGLPSARISAEAQGGTASVTLDPLRVEMLDGRIDVRGRADLAEALSAQASVEIDGIDPAPLVAGWPVGARLAGELEAAFDGQRLALSPVELRLPPSDLRLNGAVAWGLEDQALDVDLTWESLVWPPVLEEGAEPLVASRSGSIRGSGTLEEWQAEMGAWLKLAEEQEGEINLEASGDATSLQLDGGRMDFGAFGQADLLGGVEFGEQPRLALQLRLQQFDPSALIVQMPGRVDADLSVSADLGEPLSAELRIDRLTGQLRQVPLVGDGSLALVDGEIAQSRFELAMGNNRITLERGNEARWDVDLVAEALDQLWPALAGRLVLAAELSPAARRADWEIEGERLAWERIRVNAVSGGGDAQWGESPAIDAKVTATDVDLNPWERLSRVDLTLVGDCVAHALELVVDGQRLDGDLALAGALEGCLQNPTQWSGSVSELAISNDEWGRWHLEQPLPVTASADAISAGPGCLWIEGDPGRLCLTEFAHGAEGNAVIALNALPLDLLLLITDPVFTLGSEIKGLARVRWGATGVQTVDSTLALGPGEMRMLLDEDVLLTIGGARLDLNSPAPGQLDARLDLALEADSRIEARARIPDLNSPSGMVLDSRLDLELPRLDVFNRFVPELDEVSGSLAAHLELSGPLSALAYRGGVSIRNGRVLYAPMGMDVADLMLNVDLAPEQGTLEGGFRAGAGTGQIAGRMQFEDTGWSGDARIDGNDLQLFDADWLEMTISSDLALNFTPEHLNLGGGLVIDRARLGLPPGSESLVRPSPDAVVVGAEEAPEAEAPAAARVLTGEVRLEMGEDVKLAAAGMETGLRGILDISWPEDSAMPRGRGTIKLVDGSYRAYGQNLEVTEGDVLFTDQPIDNPVLDIEAVREIFGDPQVEFAGVRILGPAQRPDISLFTDPPTNAEKALTYILTGADFDHAAGQGAFSVGFWVLPRLFVSYGLGLFDSGNVLAARYELSQRWGLRATSGERDTGVDVSFIIDR